MKCKLYILDEINCAFDGLSDKHINKIIERTKLPVKGAHMTAAYRLKIDDGKESNFHENGRTFIYMLDKVLPIVADEMGYDVQIEDYRKSLDRSYSHIDESFLKEYGVELFEHQCESVNEIIDKNSGIIEVATSGGKTILCGTIVKIYEEELRFIIMVPSETLVKQTHKELDGLDVDIGLITKGMTKKKREEQWNKKHIVCTWRMVNNNKHRLHNYDGFIYDETHEMGDVMFSIFENELSHCLIRVGMTGTLPHKDKLKTEKIKCHIGGDVLYTVKAKELQDKGVISTCDIEMYPLGHYFKELHEWDWDLEEAYLHNNKERIETISGIVSAYNNNNTLILCHKQLAIRLSELTGLDYIHGDVKETVRQSYYDKFRNENDYKLIATFDTVGTGTSINEIFNLITIDVGKNDIRVIQGIGRGLRKDGETNHLKIIDIYSKIYQFNRMTGRYKDISYSGSTHVRERRKTYKAEQYPFKEMPEIKVE